MEIKEFIEKFADAIDVENVDELTEETEFRELEEWSSLSVMLLIASPLTPSLLTLLTASPSHTLFIIPFHQSYLHSTDQSANTPNTKEYAGIYDKIND